MSDCCDMCTDGWCCVCDDWHAEEFCENGDHCPECIRYKDVFCCECGEDL